MLAPQEKNTLWAEILALLEHEFPEQHVNMWLRPLQAVDNGGALRLMAPNRFAVDWVQGNALERIRTLLRERSGRDVSVSVEVGSGRLQRPRPHGTAETDPSPASGRLLATRLNPEATFELFVEAEQPLCQGRRDTGGREPGQGLQPAVHLRHGPQPGAT
jgi:chromosomal replication initiator protein